jgi:membrane protein
MVASGVAFFALFSLLPALAVMGLLLAQLASSKTIGGQIEEAGEVLPEGTPQLLREFLLAVPDSFGAGIWLSLNLLVVLWTVQRASSGLITALNVVYDEDERRSQAKREAVAIAIAICGLFFLFSALLIALVLAAVIPTDAQFILALRWPALAGLLLGGLCLLYAFGPSRESWSWRNVIAGATVATILWLISSFLFAFYMEAIGGWNRYYGSITAAVVLMTWMFIGAFVVMLGAEVDAQLEAASKPQKKHSQTKDTLDRREQAGGRGA